MTSRRLSLLGSSEQRPEALLLEMPIIREHVGEPLAPHDFHRDAVNQAVLFIRPGVIEFEACHECRVGFAG
jgi:hypothetical protein